ncbi:MAG: GH32 C-terminal domain-containing protein, partial [Megamonas funiformis]|uniref:GH32 C-terminal domain-containing protein n=1 Tax=Megamonas funiformis TaxID=437897 RepID=UPI003993306A
MSYDKDTKIFKLNRDKSGCGVKGEREVSIEPVREKMNLQIFSDRSSLEIFI